MSQKNQFVYSSQLIIVCRKSKVVTIFWPVSEATLHLSRTWAFCDPMCFFMAQLFTINSRKRTQI